jgi:transient receptor potential cation channel subfamily C member 4
MNTDALLEYNPKLADVSHHTRVAYAKFMTAKLKKEIRFEDDKVTIENEKKVRDCELRAFTRFKEKTGILKKARPEPGTSGESSNEGSSLAAPPASPVPEDISKDFRARTPIEEDPNEDRQTPTPDNILDEPVPQISSSPLPTPSPTPQVTAPTPRESPSPSPAPSDSSVMKKRSMSVISEKSDSDPTAIKTPDESDDEEEKPETSRKASKSSTHLDVPSPAPNRPISPSINLTGDKGKSKITGKTLTGWI